MPNADSMFEFVRSLGDAAVSAYRDARDVYQNNPGTFIGHTVKDGTWFEWKGGPVAIVSREMWREVIYGMNDRGELPWLLCVMAIGPDGEYYVARADEDLIWQSQDGGGV